MSERWSLSSLRHFRVAKHPKARALGLWEEPVHLTRREAIPTRVEHVKALETQPTSHGLDHGTSLSTPEVISQLTLWRVGRAVQVLGALGLPPHWLYKLRLMQQQHQHKNVILTQHGCHPSEK